MEANNNELVRRTRSKCYYSSSGGDVKVVDNSFEATEYSLVISQPIEYTKRRVQKKTAPKPQPAQPCGQKPKITAKMLNARQKLNSISNRASKVFPSIDLDASSVPKPKPITTKKKMSELKESYFRISIILSDILIFFASERLFKDGVPVKSEEEEEQRRAARHQQASPGSSDLMEIDEAPTPKHTKKIVSSTMVNQNDSSSLFGDVSELSSSGVPSISSGTMRKLAPIIAAIAADGEWPANIGHNSEPQQKSPEIDSLRRRGCIFQEIALSTVSTDEITPTDQYILTPVTMKKPTKRDPPPKLMHSVNVSLEGPEDQPSSTLVRNAPPNAVQSNVQVPRVAQQVEFSSDFVSYAPPPTNANWKSNALVPFVRVPRIIQQEELSSALVRYVAPKTTANGQSNALVPFVPIPEIDQRVSPMSAQCENGT